MSHPPKRTAMQYLRDTFPSVFGAKAPPVIMTQWGPTTESARKQAAINMKLDPDKKRAVEALLAKEMGGVAQGLMEARRRFPEAYED
jgi:hypothetical protein